MIMEINAIIEKLRFFNGKFPQDAVEAAIAHGEEITPALLGILEDVADRGASVDETGDYIAPIFAMFLLAQFRETRAYPHVVKIALLPSDDLEALFGDFITGNLDSVLASVCGGDLEGIKSVIECETADEWARTAAIDSLVVMVGAGLLSRDLVIEYFAELYRGKIARTQRNETVWGLLVASTATLYPGELIEDIERVFADELTDGTVLTLEDVREDISKGKEAVLARLAKDPHHQLVNDTVKEYGQCACFLEEEDEFDGPIDPRFDPYDVVPPEFRDVSIPYRRASPKIGRNEPCFCGSGKKYKRCCGQ
jgi:hypothetical protein